MPRQWRLAHLERMRLLASTKLRRKFEHFARAAPLELSDRVPICIGLVAYIEGDLNEIAIVKS